MLNTIASNSFTQDIERYGFAHRDFGVKYSLEEAVELLNNLPLGGRIPHKHDRNGVVSLIADPGVYPDRDDVLRPQSDNGPQAPHTDGAFTERPPVLMALYCVRKAVHGGDTILVDMGEAMRAVPQEDLNGLYLPDAMFVSRGGNVTVQPVFKKTLRGRHLARFSNHEYNESEPLNTGAESGFQIVDTFLKNPDNQTKITLQPGDLIVIDNTRTAHGRTRFDDDEENRRHLLRRWGTGHNVKDEPILDYGIKPE